MAEAAARTARSEAGRQEAVVSPKPAVVSEKERLAAIEAYRSAKHPVRRMQLRIRYMAAVGVGVDIRVGVLFTPKAEHTSQQGYVKIRY
eukprot:343660-Chlamydomonas_euryale.AAC.2